MPSACSHDHVPLEALPIAKCQALDVSHACKPLVPRKQKFKYLFGNARRVVGAHESSLIRIQRLVLFLLRNDTQTFKIMWLIKPMRSRSCTLEALVGDLERPREPRIPLAR